MHPPHPPPYLLELGCWPFLPAVERQRVRFICSHVELSTEASSCMHENHRETKSMDCSFHSSHLSVLCARLLCVVTGNTPRLPRLHCDPAARPRSTRHASSHNCAPPSTNIRLRLAAPLPLQWSEVLPSIGLSLDGVMHAQMLLAIATTSSSTHGPSLDTLLPEVHMSSS
jgi:hypothetical protein